MPDILKILESTTLAKDLGEQKLGEIATRCFEEFQMDKDSRSDWEKQSEGALKIAKQVIETKSEPWEGAANVKFPLIAGAAVQFGARAYPAIITGRDIVRTRVIGKDQDGAKRERARRVQTHMNYQLTEQMVEWDEDMDKLLHGLPVLGSFFKKTYFSPILGRSISELCIPQDIVVNNDTTKRLEDARRITHSFSLFKNHIVERQRAGLWLDKELNLSPPGVDEQGPFTVHEQHRWLDLDGDDYEEPYVVTLVGLGVDAEGEHQNVPGEVVRVVPRFWIEDIKISDRGKIQRIEPQHSFTKYSFLPDFCGKFYDIGFGQLLLPINEAINTVINQLLDAGTLANSQGGFITKELGSKLKAGKISLARGEWKIVNALMSDLRAGIFPIVYKEPSAVLFQLLGLLMEVGKQLSSVSEVMSGEQSGVNVPATTTLALIEQGLKVFSAINKRVYRSLKQELSILFRLNSRYLEDEEYFQVLDEPQVVARQDYETGACDVYPVADPNNATSVQKLIKAEALMKTIGMPGSADPQKIMHRYYEALEIEDLDQFHPAEAPPPPPDPKQEDIKSKTAERQAKLPGEIEKTKTESIKNIAQAEAAELGPQLEAYNAALSAIVAVTGQAQAQTQEPVNDAGSNGAGAAGGTGMGGLGSNPQGLPPIEGGMPEMGGAIMPGGDGGGIPYEGSPA